MATWTHRVVRLALIAGVTAALSSPQIASAHSRRHVDKPSDDISLLAVPDRGAHAPEINPSVLGSVAALLAGGLALVGRRRHR